MFFLIGVEFALEHEQISIAGKLVQTHLVATKLPVTKATKLH